MSFFLDDSPPTTLSAGLTTVATVTTRVHGCVGTHLFKSRPRHGAAEIVVTGRPRMPHPASSRPHDSRSQHMRPPPCPGSPLSKDHVPADTEPSWEPHGPKARRLTICNSSPRAPRRLSTAVVVHDLWQQVHVRMSIAYHLPPINQEDLVHCMLRWVSSRLKHRCSTHQIVTSKISSFVHLMNRRHRKETCTFFHAVHICSIQMVFH